MNRLALLVVVLCAAPLANAQISAKLVMEDQRTADHTLWLKWRWDNESLACQLELSGREILKAEHWELCFESEQGLSKLVEICRAPLEAHGQVSGIKRVQIRGREIRTLTGRAWLIESIKTL